MDGEKVLYVFALAPCPSSPGGGKLGWGDGNFIRVVMFCLTISGLLAGNLHAADPHRPFRIGALSESWGPTPQVVGLRDGLIALGYHEDKDFVLGIRFTQGDLAALPAAARELVQYGVDLIVAHGGNTAKAAQAATSTIPIVFAGAEDPVGAGLIESFARPGGNITGVTTLDLELSPKRLQVFHDMIPALRRVLFPYDPTDAGSVAAAQKYRDAAQRLGIVLVAQTVDSKEEAQAVLTELRQKKVDGILAPRCCALDIPGSILRAATQQAVPTMYNVEFFPTQGALASYGPNFYQVGKQAARLVDKIIKGANPAAIPVEASSEIEFVINLKTAKALGRSIAPQVLYQADRLIR
jgi:putative ABC transport system substrate-binding protein